MFTPTFIVLILFKQSYCVPVANMEVSNSTIDLQYERYLQEVRDLLAKDPKFADATKDKTHHDNVAEQLYMVREKIRTRLDQLKQKEVRRIIEAEKLLDSDDYGYEQDGGRVDESLREHLDASSEKFSKEDLRRVVKMSNARLEEYDVAEDDDYKRYEMEKEAQWRQQLAQERDPARRRSLEEEHRRRRERQAEHEPIHAPGSKAQMQEVWEDEDHLDPKDFNVKTIHKLHDTNNDGYWDRNEVAAFLQHELDKAYNVSNPDDDMVERYHDMEKMRAAFDQHADANRDGLVSVAELEAHTKSKEYQQDAGWKTQEETEPPFSEAEFDTWRAKHHEYDVNNDDADHNTKLEDNSHKAEQTKHHPKGSL